MIVALGVWRARRLLAGVLIAVFVSAALRGRAQQPLAANHLAHSPSGLGACHEHGALPDARCTPGAVRRGISLPQICAYGYSRSVRPPESYTEPLKLSQMRSYRLPGRPSEYEEDHLVPLSIGGAAYQPANLWPEPRHGAYSAAEKDQLESWVARMACARRVPLRALQREIAGDWTALFRATGGERVLHSYPAGG